MSRRTWVLLLCTVRTSTPTRADSNDPVDNLAAGVSNMRIANPSRSRRGFSHYVVLIGRRPGIFTSWVETQQQVSQYPGACFQGLRSESAAITYWDDFRAGRIRPFATQTQQSGPEQQSFTQPQQGTQQRQQLHIGEQQSTRNPGRTNGAIASARSGGSVVSREVPRPPQREATYAGMVRREVHRDVPSPNGPTLHQVLVYYDDPQAQRPEQSLAGAPGQSQHDVPPPYTGEPASTEPVERNYFAVIEGQRPGVYES